MFQKNNRSKTEPKVPEKKNPMLVELLIIYMTFPNSY